MPLSINHKVHLNEPSDEALVSRLVTGEELALNILIARHKKRLYSFIVRYVGDPDISYDLLQECFIRMYYKAGTFNASYRFTTWLFQIALNLCRDYRRKQVRMPMVEFTEDLQDSLMHPEEEWASKQALNQVQFAVLQLPPKLKEVIILHTFLGYSQSACADILQTSAKAIETRVYRARKLLMQQLNHFF